MSRDEQDRDQSDRDQQERNQQERDQRLARDNEKDGTAGAPRMVDAQDDAAQEAGSERTRAADAGDQRAEAEQADVRSRSDARRNRPGRIVHAAEWLDGKLVRRLGGADLGPYDQEPEDSVRAHDVCPLCGHPMAEHQIDRSHPNAVLICPAERIPPVESHEPLNEVGMPKRSGQGEP